MGAPRGQGPGPGPGATGGAAAGGARRDRLPSAGSGGQSSLYELDDDGDQRSWAGVLDSRGRVVVGDEVSSRQSRKTAMPQASRVDRMAKQAAHRRLSEPANEGDDPDDDHLSTSEFSAASANEPGAGQTAQIRSRFPHSDASLFKQSQQLDLPAIEEPLHAKKVPTLHSEMVSPTSPTASMSPNAVSGSAALQEQPGPDKRRQLLSAEWGAHTQVSGDSVSTLSSGELIASAAAAEQQQSANQHPQRQALLQSQLSSGSQPNLSLLGPRATGARDAAAAGTTNNKHKKGPKTPSFQRSEEVGIAEGVSTWRSTLQLATTGADGFVEGLGRGQLVGRQVLGSPCLGEIQLGLFDRKGHLEVEVIRARGLQLVSRSSQGAGGLPQVHVSLHLMDGKDLVEKQKVGPSAHRTLEPLFQQTATFVQVYKNRTLRVTLWGNLSRIERKVFMGVAQVDLSTLNLNSVTISWYRLFSASSLVLTPVPSSSNLAGGSLSGKR